MQSGEQKATCASCVQDLSGKFCSHCGEKVVRAEDRTLKHFFEEFFHILTHADSKFLKSLKYMLTRPGFLTKEYISGRRKKYATPLSLFFIGNLIYLLILPVDALNTHYGPQVGGQLYSSAIQQQAEQKMEARHWTEAQMEEHYDAKSAKVSKFLLIVIVLLFAVPVSLIFYSRERFFADHVVFATEFINYLIYFVFTIIPYIYVGLLLLFQYVSGMRFEIDLNSEVSIMILAILVFAQLAISSKRVYGGSWLIPRALLLTFSVIFVVTAYRFILFQTVMLML